MCRFQDVALVAHVRSSLDKNILRRGITEGYVNHKRYQFLALPFCTLFNTELRIVSNSEQVFTAT